MEHDQKASREMTPLELFDSHFARVNEERGQHYGHPLENFTQIEETLNALGFNDLNTCKLPQALRPAVNHIVTRLSRLMTDSQHIDAWIDIAGYARAAVMAIDKTEMLKKGIPTNAPPSLPTTGSSYQYPTPRKYPPTA